jgi:hypothetical protein
VIKKYLQKVFKKISYSFFLGIYGKIENIIKNSNDDRIQEKKIVEKELKYKVYIISKGRLYTDRIHDTAAILDNKIIEGPSFQLRQIDNCIYNSKIEDNIVFEKGTPRKLKKLNGTVFSLLTGGAGNNNYWHWLFDVLPRFGMYNKFHSFEEINYFLLPSLEKKFQSESLDLLKIPERKRISSKKYRHIQAESIVMTDHPVVTTGNATKDIQNIPSWIMSWLKSSFLKNTKKNTKKNKIYIDRGDDIKNENLPPRMISNNEEIKNYLLKNNFVSVVLQELSFSEQINLFYNAECIVGLHGAGFGNISFCDPGTKIIELRSSTAGDVIKNLANKIDLDYRSVDLIAKEIYKYDFPNQQGSIYVPINNLEKLIKK